MHFGLLTSGGDAPGMNAAIRAVVLTAHHYHHRVTGFCHGYNGLLDGDGALLADHQVRDLIHRGGTLLKSARCEAFRTPEGARQAAATLEARGIDCLIVIGGDGSFQGGVHLSRYWSGQVLGVPGTIDNDVDGTDQTIGFATATATAVEAIDRIRDTAEAFERIFLVEVMGRHASFLALDAGMACGAEQILTFENCRQPEAAFSGILDHLQSSRQLRGNASYIIVVAEHAWPGGTVALAQRLSKATGIDCRPSILGYIQRGGSPVPADRLLATRLGIAAVECAMSGQHLKMVGECRGRIELTPLAASNAGAKAIDPLLARAHSQIFDLAANRPPGDNS